MGFQSVNISMICLNCQTNDAVIKFCSRSCAATFNNKNIPKRKRARSCGGCDGYALNNRKFCEDCISSGKHFRGGMPLAEKTLLEETGDKVNDANKYNSIRKQSRIVMRGREKCCQNCNYDKHVEICHIIPIKDFPLDALVKAINDPNNLVYLCPNCHWEFDKGLIQLVK